MNKIVIKDNLFENGKDNIKSSLMGSNVIVYPTDTAYALGVNVLDNEAVSKLLLYKGKRGSKSFSIMVSDINMAKEFVYINLKQEQFIEKYKDKGLTVILKYKNHLDNTARYIVHNNSVAVRFSNIAFIKDLISTLGFPITATSANISFGDTPYSIDDLIKNTPKEKLDMISYIIDIGIIDSGNVSTIIDIRNVPFKIIRQGVLKI